ncbi:MAG: ribulose-phosphate 3-epimerase [Alphaproteobacteria bacterium]|nr:ribulose-phosphate 3-epimerase [Alphaproteobacteria bacterium]
MCSAGFVRISSSLLSGNLLNLSRDLECLTEAGVGSFHIDVMDGHFVPSFAFGIEAIKQIATASKLPVSVHLMVDNPENFIDVVCTCEIESLIIHGEGRDNISPLLGRIKEQGVKAGLAINPESEVSDIARYLPLVDLVLIMGVHPGFGGQALIPLTIEKIPQIRAIRPDVPIGVDGGVNDKTAALLNREKPDILIAGSYLLNGSKPQSVEVLREKLKALCPAE